MDLSEKWKITRQYLQQALSLLPDDPVCIETGGSVEAFRDWLDHNELELALDELEMLAESNPVRPEFWAAMLSAADEMGLHLHAARYRLLATELDGQFASRERPKTHFS